MLFPPIIGGLIHAKVMILKKLGYTDQLANMWLHAVSFIRTTCRTRLPGSSRTLSCRRHAIWIDCQRTSAPEPMTLFNISSQGDLSTTTDHLSIEIAVYFVSPGQRCMCHHVEDHSTNHRGWAHGYRLRRNLTWWIKLVLSFAYTICGRSVRPPLAHRIVG